MKLFRRTIFTTLLISACALGGACGGTEEGPAPGQTGVNVSGLWQGTWRTDTNSSSGGVTVSISQNAGQLSGQGTLTNIPIVNTQKGPFTGDIDGRTITGTINATLADVTFKVDVALDGKSAHGQYTMTGGIQGSLDLTR
jgi:hypothetical protein